MTSKDDIDEIPDIDDFDSSDMILDTENIMTLKFNNHEVRVYVSFLNDRIRFLRTEELIQFIEDAIIPKAYHDEYAISMYDSKFIEYDLTDIIKQKHLDSLSSIIEFRKKYNRSFILDKLRVSQYEKDVKDYIRIAYSTEDKYDLDFLQIKLLYFKTHYPWSRLEMLIKRIQRKIYEIKVYEYSKTAISQELSDLSFSEYEFNPIQ